MKFSSRDLTLAMLLMLAIPITPLFAAPPAGSEPPPRVVGELPPLQLKLGGLANTATVAAQDAKDAKKAADAIAQALTDLGRKGKEPPVPGTSFAEQERARLKFEAEWNRMQAEAKRLKALADAKEAAQKKAEVDLADFRKLHPEVNLPEGPKRKGPLQFGDGPTIGEVRNGKGDPDFDGKGSGKPSGGSFLPGPAHEKDPKLMDQEKARALKEKAEAERKADDARQAKEAQRQAEEAQRLKSEQQKRINEWQAAKRTLEQEDDALTREFSRLNSIRQAIDSRNADVDRRIHTHNITEPDRTNFDAVFAYNQEAVAQNAEKARILEEARSYEAERTSYLSRVFDYHRRLKELPQP